MAMLLGILLCVFLAGCQPRERESETIYRGGLIDSVTIPAGIRVLHEEWSDTSGFLRLQLLSDREKDGYVAKLFVGVKEDVDFEAVRQNIDRQRNHLLKLIGHHTVFVADARSFVVIPFPRSDLGQGWYAYLHDDEKYLWLLTADTWTVGEVHRLLTTIRLNPPMTDPE